MKQQRPINLNLLTIKFPLPAIISILHRISGFALFLIIPVLLWALSFSLTPQGFDTLQAWLAGGFVKFIFWVLLVPFCFHLVAGIRHLLMDVHVGSSLAGARKTAVLTFVVSIILVILAGVWLW